MVLWSNGGPGCTGLYGAMNEMGPLRINKKLKPELNPDAWTKFVNMVFIEQPAGIGFSTNSKNDTIWNDEMAAADMWAFIRGFLELHPQLRNVPLFLSAESYGGHYIPHLGRTIVNENDGSVKFRGMVIGNGYWHVVENMKAQVGLLNMLGVVPEPNFTEYMEKQCYYTDFMGAAWLGPPEGAANLGACNELLSTIYGLVAEMDVYALGFPVCAAEEASRVLPRKFSAALRRAARRQGGRAEGPGYDQCWERQSTAYLNLPEVQRALHVRGTVQWVSCNDPVFNSYDRESLNSNSVPILKELIARSDLKILVLSGTSDAVCPTKADEWIWSLTPATQWQAWKFQGQVAGFTGRFGSDGGFTYTTVHGAGHMIPMTQPARCAAAVRAFLGL